MLKRLLKVLGIISGIGGFFYVSYWIGRLIFGTVPSVGVLGIIVFAVLNGLIFGVALLFIIPAVAVIYSIGYWIVTGDNWWTKMSNLPVETPTTLLEKSKSSEYEEALKDLDKEFPGERE